MLLIKKLIIHKIYDNEFFLFFSKIYPTILLVP